MKGSKGLKIVKKFQKRLIEDATKAEKQLISYLKKNKLYFKFQHILQGESGKYYIADFYIPNRMLVIEVDGNYHYSNEKQYNKDRERTFDLEKLGIKVIRLRNREVLNLSDKELKELINRKVKNYVASVYFKIPNLI